MVACLTRRVVVLLVCLSSFLVPVAAFAQDAAAYAPEPWVDRDTLPGATLFRHPASWAVKNLYGTFSFYGVEDTTEGIARMFLGKYSDVLEMLPDTSDLVFDGVIEGEALQHVWFHQEYKGVPVWRGYVAVHLTRDQRVVKVDSHYVPGLDSRAVTPAVSAAAAAHAATVSLSGGQGAVAPVTTSASSPELYVYWDDLRVPRPVWVTKVTTAANPFGYKVVIDGQTGETIEVNDTRVMATGKVFNPNPVVTYSLNPAKPPSPNTVHIST